MERTITRFFRKSLLTILSAGAISQAGAQVSSYIFTQSATNYTQVSGTVIAQATGTGTGQRLNDGNTSVTLPFSFNFNGTSYTTVNVNANGYITFGATAPATTLATPISSNTGYSGAVAALGSDIEGVYEFTASMQAGSNRLSSVSRLTALKPGQDISGIGIAPGSTITSITNNGSVFLSSPVTSNGTSVLLTALTGKIRTQTIGSSPNRTFVIQWEGFKQTSAANSSLNFQIQLAEAAGVAAAQSVAVVYGQGRAGGAGAAEIGLRGATNADYNNRVGALSLTNTVAGAANNNTVSFNSATVFPVGLTFTWSRQALPTCGGTPAGGTAISSVGSSCAGSFALMNPTAATGTGITYQWQSGPTATGAFTDIIGASTNPYTAASQNTAIFYRLNVKCGVNTGSSAPVGVNHDALGVRIGNDTTLCPGDAMVLDATNAGSDFAWSNGGTLQETTINGAGTFSVIVTDPISGCTGGDTLSVTAGQVPFINLGNDRAICQGTSIILNAGNAGSTFAWNTGANTQTISVNRLGTFFVKVTNTDRCSNTDTVNITIDPLPTVGLIGYNGVMPTLTFSVSSATNVTAYNWNFDDNGATSASPTPTHTFSHDGTFNVRLIVSNNCGSDTLVEVVHIFGAGNGVGNTRLDPNSVSLYPNPAHDYVMLDNKNNLKIEEVQVTNVVGAIVIRQNGKNSSNMRVSTSGLPAGTYLIRVITDKGIVVKKLEVLK